MTVIAARLLKRKLLAGMKRLLRQTTPVVKKWVFQTYRASTFPLLVSRIFLPVSYGQDLF